MATTIYYTQFHDDLNDGQVVGHFNIIGYSFEGAVFIHDGVVEQASVDHSYRIFGREFVGNIDLSGHGLLEDSVAQAIEELGLVFIEDRDFVSRIRRGFIRAQKDIRLERLTVNLN